MHLLSSMYFAQEKTKTEDDFIISQRLKGYLKVKLNKVRKDKTLVLKFLKNSKARLRAFGFAFLWKNIYCSFTAFRVVSFSLWWTFGLTVSFLSAFTFVPDRYD